MCPWKSVYKSSSELFSTLGRLTFYFQHPIGFYWNVLVEILSSCLLLCIVQCVFDSTLDELLSHACMIPLVVPDGEGATIKFCKQTGVALRFALETKSGFQLEYSLDWEGSWHICVVRLCGVSQSTGAKHLHMTLTLQLHYCTIPLLYTL